MYPVTSRMQEVYEKRDIDSADKLKDSLKNFETFIWAQIKIDEETLL